MDEAAADTADLLTALFAEMIRTGIIPEDVIDRVAERFEAEGGERGERLAHLARCILMEGLIEPTSESDFRAQYYRRQIRERTKLIERDARLTAVTGDEEDA